MSISLFQIGQKLASKKNNESTLYTCMKIHFYSWIAIYVLLVGIIKPQTLVHHEGYIWEVIYTVKPGEDVSKVVKLVSYPIVSYWTIKYV